jgi:O-antigen ligase
MIKESKVKINPYKSPSFFLVAIGLFFLPFNSYQGISFLGEFARDSCIIFFLAAFVLQLFEIAINKKVIIPSKHPLFLILLGVLTWFFLTYLLNIIDINSYYIKKTPGHLRFISQYGALIISAVFLLITYYNTFSKFKIITLFLAIRKILFYSFIVVSIYTALEIAIIYFNINSLTPVLYLFDYFPFCESWLDTKYNRVSSVTFEPPAFATYLISIAGWMFSYIITHKGLKAFIPGILVILFSFFSGSRSGLIIIIFQLLVFIIYFVKRRRYHKNLIKITMLFVLLSIPVLIYQGKSIGLFVYEKLTSFNLDDDTHSNSNKSRFGLIYTSGLVFLENPIVGVGFGQQAYEARKLYPSWATKDNWEFRLKYSNDNIEAFPPGYNMYTRLLAETGIIGFFCFLLFIFICCYISYKKINIENKIAWTQMVLLVSFVGISINWFKSDTFRFYLFWMCLALLILSTKNLKLKHD